MSTPDRTTSTTRAPKNHVHPRDDLPIAQVAGTCVDSEMADRMLSLAERINKATAEAEGRARAAMNQALIVGGLLNEAKSQVPHGEWDTWLTTHCKVAPRTARAYMRLVKRLPQLPEPERQRVADLPVREAVCAIAMKADAPPRTTAPARSSAIQIEGRDDAERAFAALESSATALLDAARTIEKVRELGSTQVKALRSQLTSAIDALDQLAGE